MSGLSVVRPTRPKPGIHDLVEEYLLSCEARGLAPSTVSSSYGYPLRHLVVPWCKEHQITTPSELDGRTVDAFTTHLLTKRGERGKLSRHTIHAYIRSIRLFLTWCERQGEGAAARPQLPRLPKRVVDVLTWEEIEKMEIAAANERDKILIRTLAEGGMRATELCGVGIGDLIRRGRSTYIKVNGKGARERLIPIMPPLYRRIERYIDQYRPQECSSDKVFVSVRRGRTLDYEPLTCSALLKIVRESAQKAGIKKRVYTHLLRHSFFTNGLRSGMNTILLAQIGGHTSIRMLEQVYSHLDMDDAYVELAKMLNRKK